MPQHLLYRRQGDAQRLRHSQCADLIIPKLKRLYVVILKRVPFQFVVTKAAIRGQDCPSVLADKGEPLVIRCPAQKEIQVPMHLNSVAGQHLEYGLAVT
jgi:hypothetical protein